MKSKQEKKGGKGKRAEERPAGLYTREERDPTSQDDYSVGNGVTHCRAEKPKMEHGMHCSAPE